MTADANHTTLEDLKGCTHKGIDPLISVPERMHKAQQQEDHSPEAEA